MSILTENWHTWHIGGVDSESRPRFFKLRPQNLFLGKFGPKNSSFPFCLKIGTHSIPRMLIPNPDLYFWNFDSKINFWANLHSKSQGCPFSLKIGTHGISRMLILITALVFWMSKPKSIFGEIWTEKLKVVPFEKLSCQSWKLAYRVSRRCLFLFRRYFSQFPTLNPFLDKPGFKNSKFFILTENWHTWYMEDADSYPGNSFLNCQP